MIVKIKIVFNILCYFSFFLYLISFSVVLSEEIDISDSKKPEVVVKKSKTESVVEDDKFKELKNRLKELKLKKSLLETELSFENLNFKKERLERTKQHKKRILDYEDNKLLFEEKQLEWKNNRLEAKKEQAKINSKIQEMKLERITLELENHKKEITILELERKLKERIRSQQWSQYVPSNIEYHDNPVIDGFIHITDRKIIMNEVITYQLGDFVSEKIHYFNNKSIKEPIFLVIERCPGGSVIAGYKIIKAIESSPAPVYVIVKSYAASMAAIITSRAKYSYAYPQAIILHHQVSSWNVGNLTQQKERLEMSRLWMEKLYEPLAKRMNMTLEKLIERMYKENSDGDWEEFAEDAVKLKWITATVDGIKDMSIRNILQKPNEKYPRFFAAEEKKDSSGNRFVQLPRINRHDFYFIDRNSDYYRY